MTRGEKLEHAAKLVGAAVALLNTAHTLVDEAEQFSHAHLVAKNARDLDTLESELAAMGFELTEKEIDAELAAVSGGGRR